MQPWNSVLLASASRPVWQTSIHSITTLVWVLWGLISPKNQAMLGRRSETIQNLPPALFTLMKSTEPHSDLYYPMDIEHAMRDAGFTQVVTLEADHRHRAVLGMHPWS